MPGVGGRDLALLCPEQRVPHGDHGWEAAMCSLICTNENTRLSWPVHLLPPTEGDCAPRRPGSLTLKYQQAGSFT